MTSLNRKINLWCLQNQVHDEKNDDLKETTAGEHYTIHDSSNMSGSRHCSAQPEELLRFMELHSASRTFLQVQQPSLILFCKQYRYKVNKKSNVAKNNSSKVRRVSAECTLRDRLLYTQLVRTHDQTFSLQTPPMQQHLQSASKKCETYDSCWLEITHLFLGSRRKRP